MGLFDSVTKGHVQEAINTLLNGALKDFPESKYYDVLFNDQRLPPKPIMALALKFATGKQVETTDFNGGEKTQSIKRLRDLGFKIVKKNHTIEQDFSNEILKFLAQAKTENLKTKGLYRNEFLDLKVEVSFGAGNSARISGF